MASAQFESDVFSIKTTTTTSNASNITATNMVVSITEATATAAATTTVGTVSWTLSDFHASASNWSLHGDAKLLELMESISKNLEVKCMNTQKNMDQMVFGIDRTKIRLENTTNTMLSLKNQKFMEARVHDEVETTTNTSTSGSGGVAGVKSNEISSATMTTLKAIKVAVDNGISMMDKCYEKVTIDLNDDDDEDADTGSDVGDQTKCIIYRPKNPHYDRPLPHIIGSKEFNEKWHIGLIESEDDDEDEDDDVDDDDENMDNENLISQIPCSESSSSYGIGGHHSSDSASISVSMSSTNAAAESDTDYSRHSGRNPNIFHHSDENLAGKDPQESHHHHIPPQPSARKNNAPVPTKPIVIAPDLGTNLKKQSDLFHNSDNNNEDDLFRIPTPRKNINDRIKVLPVGPQIGGSIEHQQAPPSIFRHQKPISQPINTFNDEPPELESTAQLKVERKPVNLFLDSDDDDDDDLFKSTPKIPIANSRTNINVIVPNRTVVAPNTIKTINLFDDVTDDDDELLFSNSKSQIKNSTLKENQSSIVNTKPTITNLFEDDDDVPPEDDLFNSMISQSKIITKKPEMVKQKSIFADDEDDDDLFGAVSSSKSIQSSNIISRSLEVKAPIVNPPINIHKNIFDEDNDSGDEQFPPTIKTKISITPTNEQSSNLNDKQKPPEDVFGLSMGSDQLNKTSNIFSYDVDDDVDDFDSIFMNKPKEQLINDTEPTIKPIKSLFDDNMDADNLFVSNQKLNNKSSVKIQKSIFDDDDDDSDLFFSVPKTKSSENPLPSLPQSSVSIENCDENPVVPIVAEIFNEQSISMINSPPPSPTTSKKSVKSEQFANFLTKDETNLDSITFVHNRRPFVSFLENDSSADESDTNDKNSDDEWKSDSDGVGNLVPEKEAATETAVINNEQSKSVIKVTDLFSSQTDDDDDDDAVVDKLPHVQASTIPLSVEYSSEINIFDNKIGYNNVATTNVEKISQSISENIEKPTSQINSNKNYVDNELFIENSKIPIENKSSIDKITTTNNAGLFDDLSPDDFLSTINKSTAQHNALSKQQSGSSIFNDQPPPDDHFENIKVRPTKIDLFTGLSDEDDNSDFSIIKSLSPPSQPTLPTISSKLSSPFDDLPPIDDFAISPLPALPTIDAPIQDDAFEQSINLMKESTKSSLPSIPLFLDDTPPDDDFLTDLVNSNEKSSSTITKSVYYNDFDEAIPVNTNDVVDKAPAVVSSFKNNLEKFIKPIDELSIQQPTKQPPPPVRRKISDNLDINVAALLPGAKRPMKTTPPIPSLSVNNESVSTINTSPKIIHSNESTSTGSLLIGLNKSRPKMSISRRPSTRKGRKAEYNKSLLNDAVDSSVRDNSFNSGDMSEDVNSSPQLSFQTKSIESMCKDSTECDLQSHISSTIKVDNNMSKTFEEDMSTSFDDDPLGTDASNFVVIKEADEEEKIASTKRFTPIDGEESNRFEEITTTVATQKDGSNVSIDDNDDEDDDDDDWLQKSLKSSTFNAVKSTATVVSVVSATVKPLTTIKSNNLFSDEDDDDLFSNTKKPLKVSSLETTVPSSMIKTNRSITSSSSSASTTKSTKIVSAVSKNLFGDEDDDIDNLFGAIKSKKIVTNKITTTAVKDKKEIKSKNGIGSSLFSDDDEDDNLFSVSESKGSNQMKITTNKTTGASGFGTVNSKSVDQDPLSDLWKQ